MSEVKATRFRLRPSEQRFILLLGDAIMAFLAMYLALHYWAYLDAVLDFSPEFLSQRVDWWFYILPFGWLVMLVDTYDPHRSRSWQATLRGIAFAAFGGFVFYALVYLFSSRNTLPRQGVGAFLASAFILTLVWRSVFIYLFTTPAFMRRVLIIGAGKAGQTIAAVYKPIKPSPFHLIGYIDDDPEKIGAEVDGFQVISDSEKLLTIIEDQKISDLIIAINGEIKGDTFQTLLDAQEKGVEITRMPVLYEEFTGRVPIQHLDSDWIIRSFVDETRTHGLYELAKRVIDIIGAVVGLGILLLLLPLVALFTIIDSGLPIFYSQVRLGKGAKPHKIIKFRTMRQDAEIDGKARPASKDDPRITKVGNFLRRTRLDEFPQFWNVLIGEMSIVGPRSERPELVEQYQKQVPFYRARLLVKPGITGWAQVNFGYVSTVEDTMTKLEYDLYYIKHRSITMDLKIIFRTVGTVFGLRGR